MTALTIDQIRTKREEAETAIRNILEGLRQETGLVPAEVDVQVTRMQRYDQRRPESIVQGVAIHFEPI